MGVKKVYRDSRLLIQQKTYTCGPVSLLNVLRLKGDSSYDENGLAKLCDAKAGIGTTNENLFKAAGHIGLEIVEAKEGSALKDIDRNLDDGCYVIVNYRNVFSGNGHYSVITEYDDDAYYLYDSSLGLLRLAKDYFRQNWYGKAADPKDTVYGWFMAVR